jgi:hypothetical protein
VCNENVYSRTGIHPQCSAAQSERAEQLILRAEAAAKAAELGDVPAAPKMRGYGQAWRRKPPAAEG